ncbi:MAG: segregation/condensation protein A [Acidobacteria bacterium]|nr:segregation/condensation protein A [Acidobacteriota bacterium]
MTDEQYRVHLPAYDGPLDLLLDLIRKQQINIYDVPIAQITEQYLVSVRMMEELDISVAGEFLLMAATLIYIKSRMLLPKDPLLPEGEDDDPRAELVARLLEHEKFKNAAQMLYQKELVENSTWSRAGIRDWQTVDAEEEIQVTLFDLVSTFQKILERAKAKAQLEIERDEMTVGQVMERLRGFFEQARGTVNLTKVFDSYRSRQALIVAFLAILEMVHLQAIKLLQKQAFGEILARRQENFDAAMQHMDEWMGASAGTVPAKS